MSDWQRFRADNRTLLHLPYCLFASYYYFYRAKFSRICSVGVAVPVLLNIYNYRIELMVNIVHLGMVVGGVLPSPYQSCSLYTCQYILYSPGTIALWKEDPEICCVLYHDTQCAELLESPHETFHWDWSLAAENSMKCWNR